MSVVISGTVFKPWHERFRLLCTLAQNCCWYKTIFCSGWWQPSKTSHSQWHFGLMAGAVDLVFSTGWWPLCEIIWHPEKCVKMSPAFVLAFPLLQHFTQRIFGSASLKSQTFWYEKFQDKGQGIFCTQVPQQIKMLRMVITSDSPDCFHPLSSPAFPGDGLGSTFGLKRLIHNCE